MKALKYFFLFAVAFGYAACMDQYNPRPYWAQFKSERETTSSVQPKLTKTGELPPKEAPAVEQDPISAKFTSLCSSCHGAEGKADGAAAASMNPKPRNFHDKAWQAKVTDEHIAAVIKNGGASVGLSGTMPPWGAILTGEEVTGLVGKVRAWGK